MENYNDQPKKASEKRGSNYKLSFNVNIAELKGEDLPDAVAYVFDSKNRLIDQKKLRNIRGDRVIFDLPAEMKNEKVRVVVGPRVTFESADEPKCLAEKLPYGKKPMRAPTPDMLLLRGGVEQRIRIKEGVLGKDIAVLNKDIIKWLECSCKVSGRLVKEFVLPDGTVKELGVCGACVYIWEVDGISRIIAKLPELEILRLRDDLIRVIKKWPPEPWPPISEGPWSPEPWLPGPGPDPAPFLKTEFVEPLRANIAAEFEATDAVKLTESAPKYMPDITELSGVQNSLIIRKMEEFDSIITAQSAVSLRRELLLQAKLLIPYLCHFPWIYYYISKEFLTCACTDSEGYFERTITYPCSGDKPDLYFTAYQCIDGNWVTLYDPGLSCHVHWNYECGTEVRLVTTEPGARVCVDDKLDPPPGVTTWVEPHGIGGFNLSQISSEGRVDYYHGGHLVEDAPFGSTIGFRMGHSNTIPNNDVHYYRVLYRKGTTGAWHEFTTPVTRHYVHDKDGQVTFPVVLLGPIALKDMHLYRFKPDKPSALDPSLNDAFDYWPDDNWFSSDIYSGYLNTAALPGGVDIAHGLYQIKIEIYNSSGNIVDPDVTNPKFKFIMPTAPDSGSVATPTCEAPVGYRDGKGFIFNISIDNRPCTASIDLPVVGGVIIDETSPEGFVCGFLKYKMGDDIEISFTAKQPGNNAEARFTLKRGYAKLDPQSMQRTEVATALSPIGPGQPYQNVSDGDFHQTFAVSNILGTCINAAFAEHLYVWAKATNGWQRLSGYDAAALRAFALAKNIPGGGGSGESV